MSTQKDIKAADSASLGMLCSQTRVVGAKQIRKALNAGKAKAVFLAQNADPAITEPLAAVCQQNNVEFVWVKGHAGHPQNERCDVLATTAADSDNLLDDVITE